MPFKTFSLAESFNAAANMAKTSLALEEYGEGKAKKDEVRDARKRAIGEGTPDAMKALMAIDPEEGANIVTALSKMDERQRKEVKYKAEEDAKAVIWVMQGADDAEKADRWNQVVDFRVSSGAKEAEQFRDKYSEGNAQLILRKAMTIDDINDQFAFGQMKIGVGKDGKPAYFVTNELAQTKEIEDFRPTEYQAKGKAKEGKDFAVKASDSNTIRSGAAGLFGGTYSPETGRVMGVEKGSEAKVLAISERASAIYSEGKGKVTHDQANAQAARELGIKIPKVGARSIKDFLKEQKP